jgi:acyl-CoA synthetase (AMP-forming)/AMP-acid ligase II
MKWRACGPAAAPCRPRPGPRIPRWADWLQTSRLGLQQFDARLGFRTSGSSGLPKACTHSLALLQQEVEHLAQLLVAAASGGGGGGGSGSGGIRRIVSAVPAHHSYSFLFAVLLPTHLGVPVLDVRGLTAASLLARLTRAALRADAALAARDGPCRPCRP